MERLTKRLEDGQAVFHECHGTCGTCDGATCYCIGPMVDRLAAYEDTGLEPRDVISAVDMAKIACALHELNAYKDLGSIEHLRELIQAEQDARLVVLPCKVGDKVRVDARTWGDTWNYKTVDGGKYLLGETVAIIKTRKQTFIKIRVEHNVSWKRPMRRYPISAIGKTIFLTREEAEEALAGKGGIHEADSV